MNFDLNALKNIAELFGRMPNASAPHAQNPQNTPRNAQNRRDKAKNGKTHANSPFASQNGLGERVDVSSFDGGGENGDDRKPSSPFENVLSLMSKKGEIEKMMPAFASVFSKAKVQNAENTKEKSKPKDLFGPIEFAGYTVLCAMNRLYFSLK
ncbi:MAG: hypothetical protein IK048_00575 [Clostridia bacterium]|nr:hypothetical protein [Clostridia bacterium]